MPTVSIRDLPGLSSTDSVVWPPAPRISTSRPFKEQRPDCGCGSAKFRVIYRALTAKEVQALPGSSITGFLVARVVNRRDLDRALESF